MAENVAQNESFVLSKVPPFYGSIKEVPYFFQGHMSNFKVTRGEKLTIWLWFEHFRLVTPIQIYGWLWNDTHSIWGQGRFLRSSIKFQCHTSLKVGFGSNLCMITRPVTPIKSLRFALFGFKLMITGLFSCTHLCENAGQYGVCSWLVYLITLPKYSPMFAWHFRSWWKTSNYSAYLFPIQLLTHPATSVCNEVADGVWTPHSQEGSVPNRVEEDFLAWAIGK